jgi:predicted negative regulator of RcsB-dependent stress response
MKTERRHELQHNQLSDQMGALVERVRPYTATIVVSLVLIVAAMLLYSFWTGQQHTQRADAWEAYFSATQSLTPNLEKLEQVSTQFPRDDVGLWARIMLADYQLAEGSEDLFSDRTRARTNLAKAVENYSHVLDNTREDALRERALIGLARAYEGQGELEKARQRYQVVLQNSPNGPFSLLARERLDDLELARTKEFYDWFGKEEPKPAAAGAAATGDPLDFDLSKLPDAPASQGGSMLQLPEFPVGGGSSTSAEQSSAPDVAAPPAPSGEQAPSAPGTPAVDGTPTDGSPPADATPPSAEAPSSADPPTEPKSS